VECPQWSTLGWSSTRTTTIRTISSVQVCRFSSHNGANTAGRPVELVADLPQEHALPKPSGDRCFP